MNTLPHPLFQFITKLKSSPRHLLFIVGLLFGSILFTHATVFAQTPKPLAPIDITVSPPLVELTIFPGDIVTKTIRIRNNSSDPMPLTITAKKLTSSSANGQPVPADPGPTDTYISWVKFDQPNFTAPPKEWTDIKFTLSIPKEAAFGYYYVFSIAQKYPEEVDKKSRVSLHSEVLVVMLMNVKKEGAQVSAKSLSFDPTQFISQFLPVSFQTVIENVGNVHVRPSGNIFIRSHGSNDIAVLDVNHAGGAILPGGKRTYTTEWNDGFIVDEPVMLNGAPKLDEHSKPVTHLVINWSKITSFRIGHYTASELLVYDDGTKDQTIEGTTSFWVIPYIPLAIILVGIIVLSLIIRFLFKLSVNRALKNTRR